MEKAMQTTPTPDNVFSTPASDDDQTHPAPPDDRRNLPELPDPTEVGEDGQAPEAPTTCKAAMPLGAGDSPTMQRNTCFFCIRRNACQGFHPFSSSIHTKELQTRQHPLRAPHRGASNSVAG
jgi:hypothetical protein